MCFEPLGLMADFFCSYGASFGWLVREHLRSACLRGGARFVGRASLVGLWWWFLGCRGIRLMLVISQTPSHNLDLGNSPRTFKEILSRVVQTPMGYFWYTARLLFSTRINRFFAKSIMVPPYFIVPKLRHSWTDRTQSTRRSYVY